MRDYLARHRQRVGWSQQQLAARSGLAISTIKSIETGRAKTPHRETSEPLERELKLQPGDIIFDRAPQFPRGLPTPEPELFDLSRPVPWVPGVGGFDRPIFALDTPDFLPYGESSNGFEVRIPLSSLWPKASLGDLGVVTNAVAAHFGQWSMPLHAIENTQTCWYGVGLDTIRGSLDDTGGRHRDVAGRIHPREQMWASGLLGDAGGQPQSLAVLRAVVDVESHVVTEPTLTFLLPMEPGDRYPYVQLAKQFGGSAEFLTRREPTVLWSETSRARLDAIATVRVADRVVGVIAKNPLYKAAWRRILRTDPAPRDLRACLQSVSLIVCRTPHMPSPDEVGTYTLRRIEGTVLSGAPLVWGLAHWDPT